MSKKTSILNKSISIFKKQYSSGESSNNNGILKLQKDIKTMKSSYGQIICNNSENLQPVSPPLRFSVEVEIEQCEPEDIILDDLFNKNPDPNLSVPKAHVTQVIKVDGKHADPKLPNSLAEDSKGVPKNNTHNNPNIVDDISDDVTILDKDETPKESAANSINLNNKGFDIKKMQTQLDEDIKKQLEVEAKISKLFQGSKSYRLFMQKELSERKKKSKKQLIKKGTNELSKKKSATQESLQTIIKIEKDLYVGDINILDYGVEDLSTINDEDEVTADMTNSEINNDTVSIKEKKKKELGKNNVNKVVLKNSTKEAYFDSDIILDCYSNNSKQSDLVVSSIVKKEKLIKDESIMEPEGCMQTKVKVKPSVYLTKEYDVQQMIVKKESFIKDCTIQKPEAYSQIKVKPIYYLKIYDKPQITNKEIFKTDTNNPSYQCSCGYFGVLKQYIEHVTIECPGTVFNCNLCEDFVRFTNLKHYLIHLPFHKFQPLSCPECYVQHKSLKDLYIHVKAHINNLFSAKKPIGSQDNELYFCKKCGNHVSFEYFFRHWQMHLNGQDSDLEENDSLEDSSDDDQDKNFKIMSPKLVEDVMKRLVKNDKPRFMKECMVCLRQFSRWQDCKRHLIEHLLSQAIYERKKLGSEILKCYFCDQGFEVNDDWKFHTREHSNLRVYQCDLCCKRFSDSSNLCKHKKSHNLFSFECDLCGGKFATKRCLIVHMKMHENTINCEFCNMAFVRRGKLRTHISQVHTGYNSSGKREHRCNICLKRFFTWKKKKQHMWVKHGKRNAFADCPLCEKRYRKFYELRKHMAVKHKTAYTKSLSDLLGN